MAYGIGLGHVRTAMASQCEPFAWLFCPAENQKVACSDHAWVTNVVDRTHPKPSNMISRRIDPPVRRLLLA
ncbi:hypothetical protein TNCV_742341 [Trichonephila clavipes]|nr:hypothetical protein TNCV_742341 [Trichonephila clavipes]